VLRLRLRYAQQSFAPSPAQHAGQLVNVRSCSKSEVECALSQARPGNSCFSLDNDLHGCRLTVSYIRVTSGLPVIRSEPESRIERKRGPQFGSGRIVADADITRQKSSQLRSQDARKTNLSVSSRRKRPQGAKNRLVDTVRGLLGMWSATPESQLNQKRGHFTDIRRKWNGAASRGPILNSVFS
jgi:hypothetical protein